MICDPSHFLKQFDLTRVKISKFVLLIMRSKYPHKKQIKIYYKIQFPTDSILNDKIFKIFN